MTREVSSLDEDLVAHGLAGALERQKKEAEVWNEYIYMDVSYIYIYVYMYIYIYIHIYIYIYI